MKVLRIKDEIDLRELEKYGFEENESYPNYVYETRTKKGNYCFIMVDKNTRLITGTVKGVGSYTLNGNEIEHFAKSIFEAEMVEEVEV